MALIAPTSMTSHSKHGSSRYSPPALLTPGQTLLWFLGGILAMFLVVSVVFAVKLGAEGRLPFLGKSARAETIAPFRAKGVVGSARIPAHLVQQHSATDRAGRGSLADQARQ
jgi:hypothetical protein